MNTRMVKVSEVKAGMSVGLFVACDYITGTVTGVVNEGMNRWIILDGDRWELLRKDSEIAVEGGAIEVVEIQDIKKGDIILVVGQAVRGGKKDVQYKVTVSSVGKICGLWHICYAPHGLITGTPKRLIHRVI